MTGDARGTSGAETAMNRRSAARLAAVQALYQMQLGGATAEEAIAQFTGTSPRPPTADDDHPSRLPPPDPSLFGAIVRGVAQRRASLDGMIGGALTTDWTVDRLQILVRLILEAGVFELTERPDVPPRVAINEYVNLAHAFFDGAEPGLINGVLDAIAKAYRGDEMARARG
ncbi:MAG: transcription antitermination factor NusB [Alphaproteobacteria bacterium]|jgi:N utilization substance protein B|nr:transcription antitermination factor NusB [Alphaproteobacteria bacterium]